MSDRLKLSTSRRCFPFFLPISEQYGRRTIGQLIMVFSKILRVADGCRDRQEDTPYLLGATWFDVKVIYSGD